jgi:hypothetical protein
LALPNGTRIGYFEIIDRLGEGGMGEVYRATDTRLGRQVAIKVLPPEFSADRDRLIRFAHEARAASSLNHPNLVTILEVGQAESYPYIAMELVDGVTLRSILDAGSLSLRKTLHFGYQIADGLAKAHEAGIVHRDLKPENIMVTRDGFVKILDFGLVKLTGSRIDPAPAGDSMTGTGFVIGTAGYMSPEQASGKPVDFRSDQFALGLIVYEMASGRRAFRRATAIQTISAIIQDEPEPIENLNPRAPEPLRWLVARCLSKDREERYASTRDLARDLQSQLQHLTSGTESSRSQVAPAASLAGADRTMKLATGAPAPAPPPSRSLKTRAAVLSAWLVFGVVLLGAGVVGGYWFHRHLVGEKPPRWSGEILLGGSLRVFSPTISPDGETLAFLTTIHGLTQVAVMKPGSGDWVVLSKREDLGAIERLDWSPDGTRIFFDRATDRVHAIYSIPVLGGEERLVVEDAQGPESLPDGNLLVLKVDPARNFQVFRLTTATGKLSPIGPPLLREAGGLSLRSFPDGKRAMFFGRPAAGATERSPRCAYLLHLDTGRVEPFAPGLALNPPISVSADGRHVLADVATGDLHQIVSLPVSGDDIRPLLALSDRPRYVSEAPDGSLFVGVINDSSELLRFAAAGALPEHLGSSGRGYFMHPVELPDGRTLLAGAASGHRRLLVAAPGEALRPFVDSPESSSPPVAVVGGRFLAFIEGGAASKAAPQIALASLPDGHVVARLEATRGASCAGMSAAADGRSLYYVDTGAVMRIDLDAGKPVRICAGNGVAVDPRDGSLVVQLNQRDGVRLVRVSADGREQAIAVPSDIRLSQTPIAGNAVGTDGRIVVSGKSRERWYTGPVVIDPAAGTAIPVPVSYDGDILPSAWGRGGSLLGFGSEVRCDLWRFRKTASREGSLLGF